MKTKLLQFFGLAIAAASLAVTFNALTAHAQGEKYIWTSAATIQASGGEYKGTTTYTVTPVKRFSGSSVELVTNDINVDVIYGACNHAPGRIVISGDKAKGTFWIGDLATGTPTGCGTHPVTEINMDNNITIAAEAAPAQPADCNTLTDADAKAKCVAVKACVTSAQKATPDCEAAWNTCIANHTKNNTITDADKKICIDAVTKGQLDVAVKPPATEDKTSCAVVGIGWIICPVVSFLAQIVDASYGLVSSFLTIQPLFIDGSTAGVYTAWSVMRNFANIAFVIAFLVIIFSQLTGAGLTNYGLKKMLPKLVVAAVFVNVSYWMCAIAVDLSNITGKSLYEILGGVTEGLKLPNLGGSASTGAGWTGIAGGILAGTLAVGALLFVGLSALLPALIAVLATIVTVLLVLVFRQALAILLIVVSPLAFVARLLPNTEGAYKQWWSLSQVVLLMYPIVGLVFGASALASTIVMGSASGPYKIAIQIMGAAISVIPLIVVPGLIKTSKGVLGKFGAIVDNPNKGPVDRARKGAEGFRKNRQQLRDARALNGGKNFGGRGTMVRRTARRQAVLSQRERNYSNAKTGYIADTALSDEVSRTQQALSAVTRGRLGGNTQGDQLLDKMAKGGADGAKNAALAQAVSVQAKIEAEEVTAASAVIKHMNLDRNQQAMRDLSMGQESNGLNGANSAVRAAAMKNVVDSHDVEGVNDLLDNVGSMDTKTREAFADSLASSSQKPEYVGQSAISNIRQHGNTDATGAPIVAQNSTQLAATAINNNTYSVDKIATGDREELEFIARVAADPSVTTNNTTLAANAHTAQTDPRYSGRIGKNVNVVDDISRL